MTLENTNAKVREILKWNKLHALLVLASGLISFWIVDLRPLLVTSFFSFMYYYYRSAPRHLKPFLGWANFISTIRLIILFVTFGFLTHLKATVIGVPLVGFLLLDALDGYLARTLGQESAFGKYLDMEADAMFVCLMTYYLYMNEYAGLWILGIGLLRYMNIIAEHLFIHQNDLAPRLQFAVFIAVGLFFSLLTPLYFSVMIYKPILIIFSILVCFSFLYSFILQLKSQG